MTRLRRCVGLGLAAVLLPGYGLGQTVPLDPMPFVRLRADETVATLRQAAEQSPFGSAQRIPLGTDPERFIAVGADIRERYEHYTNPGFGLLGPPRRQDYLLSRVLLDADIRLAPELRALVQFGRHDAPGKTPLTPVDADRFDLQQAFVDLSAPAGGAWSGTLRAGRQEMILGSGRFVDVREGPNIRQSHDGLRAWLLTPGGYRLDAFVLRPVQTNRGAFDDTSSPSQLFAGLHGSSPALLPGGALALDAYWYALQTRSTSVAAALTEERRHTLGLRAYGRARGFDHDTELLFQFGSSRAGDIRAGGATTRVGYTAAALPWQPRLGLQADWFSGDRSPDDRRRNTFNPLFPRGGYFSEPGLQTFANLIDVFPSLTLNPRPDLAVQAGVDFTWRESTRDAVYIAPGIPLPRTAAARGRYIGTNYVLQAAWSVTAWLQLNASYVHVAAGPAIANAGGRSLDYAALWTTLRF